MKSLYAVLFCLMFLFITTIGYAGGYDKKWCSDALATVQNQTHIQLEDNIAYLRILPSLYNILERNQKIIMIVCTAAVTESDNVQMITLVNNNQNPQFLHECTNCLDAVYDRPNSKAKVD